MESNVGLMEMKKISKEYAEEKLLQREKNGRRVDPRLKGEVKTGDLFLITLDDAETFLSLIWHARSDSRLLTPTGQSRTLRDVAKRVIDNGYDFAKLSSVLEFKTDGHKPEWFRECKDIYDAFDINKFDWIALTPPTNDELKESPNGIFYIYDGCHKSLVLAVRLLEGKEDFKPLECLLLVPRRN